MSGVNITVYDGKNAQQAAQRAEAAAKRAESVEFFNLRNELPAPEDNVLSSLRPNNTPVQEGDFMEVVKGIYQNVDGTDLEVVKDMGRLWFNGEKFAVSVQWDLPVDPTDGLIRKQENKPISGDTTYNYLDEVLNQFDGLKYDFVLVTGEVQANGATNTSPNWLSTEPIPVGGNKEITIIGFGNPTGVASDRRVLLRRSDGTVIEMIPSTGHTDSFTFNTTPDTFDIKINVAGATNIGADVPNSPYWHSFQVFEGEVGEKSLKAEKIIGKIETDQISHMEDVVNKIEPFIEEEIEVKAIIATQGAIGASGASNNVSSYRRTSVTNINSMAPYDPAKKFFYNGIQAHNYVGVLYLDAELNVVGYDAANGGIYTVYDNYELKNIPETTAYIATCSYLVDPVIYTKEVSLKTKKGDNRLSYYVDAINGSDEDGTGTEYYPFASINKAIASVDDPAAVIIVSAGDYRETVDLGSLPSGKFKIVNREGHRVRVFGSDVLTGWTKTPGYDNVYEIPFNGTIPNWSRNANPIYENGNPSKQIQDIERHPLQKNLSFRLPFTPILAETNIENVDANAGTYIVTGGKLYIHTTNSDDPETNSFSYENAVRAANTVNNAVTTDKKTELEIKGIQFYFNTSGVRSIGFEKVKFINCVSIGTHAAGAFRLDTGFNHLINCEAAYSNGDGFNGHFSSYSGYANLSDNRSNFPTTVYEQCWSHDNFDDGESSHEQHNVVMIRTLLEHNGDSGCRPSNDSTYYVVDSIFRYNGWEVGHGGTARKGEGFCAVNPTLNSERIGCVAMLFNCISYGNNTGYGIITQPGNRVELFNCISRDNAMAEYYCANSAILILRNCRGHNDDPNKIKVLEGGASVIRVINEEVVL